MVEASSRAEAGLRTISGPKRAVQLDALGPVGAACPPSVGSKGRTGRLIASDLLNRVNTGSPKRVRDKRQPAWRQSRSSSLRPGVMVGIVIIRDDGRPRGESVWATAAGSLTGRVKGGSARESVVDVEGVLMLPESIRQRLDSIRNLSRQGKRINGLFRLMLSPLLWERAYAEIAPNRGALTRGGH